MAASAPHATARGYTLATTCWAFLFPGGRRSSVSRRRRLLTCFSTLAPEAALTTVVAGTVLDLQEVVRIAQAGQLRTRIETYPLEGYDTALADLRAGRVEGRAVLVP